MVFSIHRSHVWPAAVVFDGGSFECGKCYERAFRRGLGATCSNQKRNSERSSGLCSYVQRVVAGVNTNRVLGHVPHTHCTHTYVYTCAYTYIYIETNNINNKSDSNGNSNGNNSSDESNSKRTGRSRSNNHSDNID